MGFLQGIVPREVHRRKLFVAVMKRFRSFGVPDKSVIALPVTLRSLVQFHFDFDAFVDSLNHDVWLPGSIIQAKPATSSAEFRWGRLVICLRQPCGAGDLVAC